MRCVGTVEFIEEFQRKCEATQLKLIEAKVKCAIEKENAASAKEKDSDKENTSPKEISGKKRRPQPISSGKENAAKILPLRVNNNQNLKFDSERRTRSYLGKLDIEELNNAPKKPLELPKSAPVPVKVKLETENSEAVVVTTEKQVSDVDASNLPPSDVHADELVWIPHSVMLPEAGTPKSAMTAERHDKSPTAGDEPEHGVETTPEKCSRSVEEKQAPPTGCVPKSVAEPTVHAARSTVQATETPRVRDTRRSTSLAKKPKVEAKDETTSDESNDSEHSETPRKFAKISDLITEDQKRTIETKYSVVMSAVDEGIVGDNILSVGEKKFGCKICNASYARQDKCRVHVWGHLNMKPYRCKCCDFATVTVSNIRCHIRKSHLKIKPYSCEFCGKCYATAFLMEEHTNTHTGARPYSCNLCEFTSASRQVLSYHTATHKPTKDVVCSECDKTFYSKARLRAHSVIHNKDRAANMCKLCSIYLCSSESLVRHNSKVHSKLFFCDHCGKSCRTKKAIVNHMVVHWPARFHCKICGHSYKSSHILKEHLLKHEGIRKYKCTVCDGTFAQQSHLAAHMAVHSDVRFYCPGCKRAFNRHDNMKAHTKRCKLFLDNPELVALLKIRKPRSKPSDASRTNLDRTIDSASTSPQETQKSVQVSSVSTTDGPFLKVELIETNSNENAVPSEQL